MFSDVSVPRQLSVPWLASRELTTAQVHREDSRGLWYHQSRAGECRRHQRQTSGNLIWLSY